MPMNAVTPPAKVKLVLPPAYIIAKMGALMVSVAAASVSAIALCKLILVCSSKSIKLIVVYTPIGNGW